MEIKKEGVGLKPKLHSKIDTTSALMVAFGVMFLLKATSFCLELDSDFILENFGSLNNFKNFTDDMGTKAATCTILASALLSIFIRAIISNNIRKNHPKSNVLYKYYPMFFIGLFAQFFAGYGIGSEIIPSFLFFDHMQQSMSTYIVFAFHVLLALSASIVFTIFAAYSIVLTDKELLAIVPFVRQKLISIENIEDIRKTKEGYEIFSINGEMIPLKFGSAKEKCYKLLTCMIEKNKGKQI